MLRYLPSHRMTDDDFRRELVLRKQRLRQQVVELQNQEAACDALLSTLPATRQPDLIAATNSLAKPTESIVEIVRRAIDSAPKVFTVNDVLAVTDSVFNGHPNRPSRDTVSGAVWRQASDLIAQGKLHIKEKGQGRRPTAYEKL